MPRKTEVVQKIRDERRREITKAALKVFARKGFASTKITDIAATAGISHGLVNHYFTTKEDLYSAIVEDTLEGALQVATQASEQSGNPWERLEWLCQNMLDGIRQTPEYGLVMTQIGVAEGMPTTVEALYADFSRSIHEKITLLIAQGQQQGQITPGDPGQLAFLFIATVSGLSLIAIDPNVDVSPIPDRPDMILRMLKA